MSRPLEAHETNARSFYADGEIYDRIARYAGEDAEIAFYDALAKGTNASILELGCGTGRLSIPLAAKGHAVTGLDCAAAMLEVARAKASAADVEVDFVQADMRCFNVESRPGLVILPYNTIGHLHSLDDLMSCFSRVHAQMAPDGMFVIDVDNPTPYRMGQEPVERRLLLRYPTESGEWVDVYETIVFDWAEQIQERTLFVQRAGQQSQIDLRTRVLFPQELGNLLRTAGFEIALRTGGFDTATFGAASDSQLLVCVRRAGEGLTPRVTGAEPGTVGPIRRH